MSDYQLIVIGAGPGGYVTAIRAAQLGRKVAIVEKDKIGGTCLNRGCIPTKALLHSANTYAGRNQFETLGLSYADIRYDMGKIHARKAQVVETLISGVSGLLKANKIDVLSGAAQITAPGKVVVDGKEYTCEDIVIATGSYPARPPIPGLDLPGVVTSNEVLEGEPVDYKSLIIIGGGVIGVELASFYAALGCKVTIVEALDRLLSTLDKEFGQSIAMLLKKRGVQVFCSSMVSSRLPMVLSAISPARSSRSRSRRREYLCPSVAGPTRKDCLRRDASPR
jgi:dihydrolipoamide dehydrogenase